MVNCCRAYRHNENVSHRNWFTRIGRLGVVPCHNETSLTSRVNCWVFGIVHLVNRIAFPGSNGVDFDDPLELVHRIFLRLI